MILMVLMKKKKEGEDSTDDSDYTDDTHDADDTDDADRTDNADNTSELHNIHAPDATTNGCGTNERFHVFVTSNVRYFNHDAKCESDDDASPVRTYGCNSVD